MALRKSRVTEGNKSCRNLIKATVPPTPWGEVFFPGHPPQLGLYSVGASPGPRPSLDGLLGTGDSWGFSGRPHSQVGLLEALNFLGR